MSQPIAEVEHPIYEITGTKQEDGHWLLSADIPGGVITHTVRSVDDTEWLRHEMKALIAAQLGTDVDSFKVRFHYV